MMVRAANDFFDKEVQPRIEQIETADPSIMRNLLEKAGEAGLLMAGVPECYGGMGTELKVNAILSAQLSRQASFFVAWSVQTGIGILPLVYFGSDTL